MILPMIKYSFIIFHKDYDQFLEKLGSLGVLDVIEREGVNKEEELSDDTRELMRIDRVLKMLQKDELPVAEGGQTAIPGHQTVLAHLEEAEGMAEKQKRLEAQMEENVKERERLEPWGDFSSSDLEKLKPAGYEVKLFKCVASRFDPE
jgi:V/A-type H+/Na+-transporting ATPase subunit I